MDEKETRILKMVKEIKDKGIGFLTIHVKEDKLLAEQCFHKKSPTDLDIQEIEEDIELAGFGRVEKEFVDGRWQYVNKIRKFKL